LPPFLAAEFPTFSSSGTPKSFGDLHKRKKQKVNQQRNNETTPSFSTRNDFNSRVEIVQFDAPLVGKGRKK
jgi:hypothetical protein